MTHDLVVRGDAWDVAVVDGVVAEVGPGLPAGRREIDARGHLVMGRGMERAAALGLPVAVHAEDPAIMSRAPRRSA